MELRFLVQGSAKDPYEVVFRKDGPKLTGLCSCPAGTMGQYCKHRLNILNGSSKGVVSANVGEVKTVQSWLPGSDVERAIRAVGEANAEFDKAKKRLSSAKKALARTLGN